MGYTYSRLPHQTVVPPKQTLPLCNTHANHNGELFAHAGIMPSIGLVDYVTKNAQHYGQAVGRLLGGLLDTIKDRR